MLMVDSWRIVFTVAWTSLSPIVPSSTCCTSEHLLATVPDWLLLPPVGEHVRSIRNLLRLMMWIQIPLYWTTKRSIREAISRRKYYWRAVSNYTIKDPVLAIYGSMLRLQMWLSHIFLTGLSDAALGERNGVKLSELSIRYVSIVSSRYQVL